MINQYRPPNFVSKDLYKGKGTKFYLVHCFECNTENYAMNVALGVCSFCGWSEPSKGRKLAHEQYLKRQKAAERAERKRLKSFLTTILRDKI